MNKYLISVEEIARKLKPILGKKIDEVYFRYMNAGSLEEKGEIFEILAGLYQKHLNKLLDKDFFLEPPKKESLEGKYALADVTYAGKKLFPSENYYLNIIGDYIVEVWLDTECEKRMQHLYSSTKKYSDSVQYELQSIIEERGKTKLVVSRNIKKAERLKKKLLKFFFVPTN